LGTNTRGKSDFKAAYRRVSLHGDAAANCEIIYKQFALPSSLRLTFGGSPCPNGFCLLSKACTNLANDILHCKDRKPSEIYSSHAIKISNPNILPRNIVFKQAKSRLIQGHLPYQYHLRSSKSGTWT
jgi:hypothetical protein